MDFSGKCGRVRPRTCHFSFCLSSVSLPTELTVQFPLVRGRALTRTLPGVSELSAGSFAKHTLHCGIRSNGLLTFFVQYFYLAFSERDAILTNLAC
jgi:hypothetical protein